MATPATKKTAFLDLSHPGWCLVIWDLFLAVPFSIFLVWLNKVVIRSIGLAAFLTSERGLLMSKVVFAVTNAACICMWAIQLNLEAKDRKKEYLAQMKRDIEEWEDEIKRLEKVKEAFAVQEALTPQMKKYKRMNSGRTREDALLGINPAVIAKYRRRSDSVSPESHSPLQRSEYAARRSFLEKH